MTDLQALAREYLASAGLRILEEASDCLATLPAGPPVEALNHLATHAISREA